MSDSYEQLSKPELVARLRDLEDSLANSQQVLRSELDVHREELNAQQRELIATQATLEATLAEYEELYDHAPLPYLRLDRYGVIESINLTAVDQLGIKKEQAIDRPFVLYVEDAFIQSFLEHMRKCRSANEEVVTELCLKCPIDGLRPVLASSRPAARVDGTLSYRTALTDLTKIKQAEADIRQLNTTLERRVRDRTQELERATEALREADRRKDDFLAMLGHELRNPLAPIRNAVDLWKLLGEQRPELEELRQVIERQVSHMARLIDDLLDVSRIIRGKIKLQRVPVDLSGIVRDVVDDFRPQVESAQLSMQIELLEHPVWVRGDETRLAQILSNLVHNAIKFTDPGGQIVIRVANAAKGHVTQSVCDTGIGMEPEMLGRLFETFSQADRTLDRSRGGLGLGLALVKGLVELHGGIVRASSAGHGQGSEITIELPLTQADSAGAKQQAGTPEQRSLRVVVIDDRHDSVLTMQRLLGRLNHEVATAMNGESGIERARELRPDVILSDIGLPGMDGYDVAREIRRDPELQSTYLVAITGYGQESDRQRAYDAGFDYHLTKPIALDDLRNLLAQVEPEGNGD